MDKGRDGGGELGQVQNSVELRPRNFLNEKRGHLGDDIPGNNDARIACPPSFQSPCQV